MLSCREITEGAGIFEISARLLGTWNSAKGVGSGVGAACHSAGRRRHRETNDWRDADRPMLALLSCSASQPHRLSRGSPCAGRSATKHAVSVMVPVGDSSIDARVTPSAGLGSRPLFTRFSPNLSGPAIHRRWRSPKSALFRLAGFAEREVDLDVTGQCDKRSHADEAARLNEHREATRLQVGKGITPR